ncbi:glycosyltransferase [Synechococcus sp. RSCCF101]|uniref:glycosyltransferase n=1 Tax=Synechococcus sp. RSCCF101 TaxID=2511069 RepID=UPI002105A754|nr:glycosyltransferase [Synechococcus sp. RSCCF101]
MRYAPARGNTPGIHDLVLETETKVIRGEACAAAAQTLRDQGLRPDLICVHPGWGEGLFLKHVWPDTPMLCYQEFWYNTEGFDVGFDPEWPSAERDWETGCRIQMKNAYLHLMFGEADWNITPTTFQRSSFPQPYQQRLSVIHDGIDCSQSCPNPDPAPLELGHSIRLEPGDRLVTFVNRRLEPYRGCHTFIRALPELQRLQPEARIVVVGETSGVSYGRPCPEGEWKELFLKEIEGDYDPSRVNFIGNIPHHAFTRLLQLSACHVYLTYPFVLSWSLLEAMSCGCAVVGSRTAPVEEVIRDGHNGVLVDFFKPGDLASAVSDLLENRALAQQLGRAARQTIQARFDLRTCLPRQLALMDLVANRALPD